MHEQPEKLMEMRIQNFTFRTGFTEGVGFFWLLCEPFLLYLTFSNLSIQQISRFISAFKRKKRFAVCFSLLWFLL